MPRATTRKRRRSTSSEDEDASDSDGPGDSRVSWRDAPPFTRVNGQDFYQAVHINNQRFGVGDVVSVLCTNGDDDEVTCLAIIESLFDDRDEKAAEVRWLVFARDEKLKGPQADHVSDDEVFETDVVDEIPLACINSHEVLVDNASRLHELPEDTYLCRFFYAKTLGTFRKRSAIVPGMFSAKLKWYNDVHLHQPAAAASASDGGGVFAQVSELLKLSVIPTKLPCRDKERKEIRAMLEGGIRRGGDQHALYISGMPGTGKTATVHEVVRSLQQDKTVPAFDVVEVNGMNLIKAQDAYTSILEQLTGARAVPERASALLDKLFASPERRQRVCVLLVDEMDHLVTGKQTLLYSIFDWPSHANAKLVVVGIANTMDLPERLLPRIASRIGKQRVTFKPYTRQEIELIVRNRLGDMSSLFDPDAIEWSARKVASLSGDIRRGLLYIRRAAEVCQRQGHALIRIEHVKAAVKEMDSNRQVRFIAEGSHYFKLVLLAVAKLCSERNLQQVAFNDVYDRFVLWCRLAPMAPAAPSRADALDLVNALAECGVLRATVVKGATTVALNVAEEHVHSALLVGEDSAFKAFA